MSGKVVLKKERSKYRYYLEDESGDVIFTGPFVATKERALVLIKAITENEHLETNLQEIQGPKGDYLVRGELNQSREGEKNYSNPVFANGMGDGIKIGYSPSLSKEDDVQPMIGKIVKAGHGATLSDETGE